MRPQIHLYQSFWSMLVEGSRASGDRLDGVGPPIGIPDVKAARMAAFGLDKREARERAVHALENLSAADPLAGGRCDSVASASAGAQTMQARRPATASPSGTAGSGLVWLPLGLGAPAADRADVGRNAAHPRRLAHRIPPWVTLAMLACAFLTVAALTEHAQPPPPGLIPLTRDEIARLAAVMIIQPARDTRYRLRWSAWRSGTSTPPGPATTSVKPPTTHDHSRWRTSEAPPLTA